MELRDKLEDLTKLSDIVKLQFDQDKVMIYSMDGSGQMVLAMKSYQVNTHEYITLDDTLDDTIECVILNAKKFVKNLKFVNTATPIKCKVTYKKFDDGLTEVRSFIFTNAKLKLNVETGNRNELKRITTDRMNQMLDPDRREWDFNIDANTFHDISKLARINSDESRRILEIDAHNGKVKLSERSLWEMEVDETDQPNANIMINKKYLPFIDSKGNDVTFNVFNNFIFIEGEQSKFMISFEQSFD